MSTAPPTANAGLDQGRRAAALRLGGLTLVTSAAALAFATDWDSAIRTGLVLSFLLFVPGLALAETLEIREPLQQLAIAAGASLALETLVTVALIYAGVFSVSLAFGIVAVLTVAALATATLRVRRSRVSVLDSEPSRTSA